MIKPSTQDRTEGKVHEVKGKIKEEVGKATNDPDLEVSGNVEKRIGKVQGWVGRAEKAVGE
ncbi:MAG TPA: CsbD family protein [Terriglobales bacterium]|nr:CsbD family protein [Terriglobales bacterium]